MEGRVRWFNEKKGYGFIETENHGDVFVHYTGIQDGEFRTLIAGEAVSFDITETPKGPQASNVVMKNIVKIQSGCCRTRTGWRIFVHPADRLAVRRVDTGEIPHRGYRALVRVGTIILRAKWARGGEDYEVGLFEVVPKDEWGDYLVPAAWAPLWEPTIEDLATRWCRGGTEGRQASYWPD